jgi:hypothetical protein
MLTEELHKLRGEGGSKETHTITLLVMLAVSAYTTIQLSSTFFPDDYRFVHLESIYRHIQVISIRPLHFDSHAVDPN